VSLSREMLLMLYFQMLRIRIVELRIESLYPLDEMRTPIHLCIGQEAVAVGVCSVLRKDDFISSNHRGHGHYLAKDGNLRAMIAELYCRETGCSKGRGGSMHLIDTSVGHIGSSSIVGGCIPIGVGLGLAIKMQKQDRVSVTFFGDGAADQGVLYESVNFAALKRLPVIFVYENNQYSVCSHVSTRQAGEVLFHAMSPELIRSFRVDGNSVLEVYEASGEAVKRARAGEGPSFIECKTYRVRGHAGSGPDTALGYRTADEVAAWEAQCPIARFRDKLLADRAITEEGLSDMEQEIEAEMDEAFRSAREGPLPREEDLALYLFRE